MNKRNRSTSGITLVALVVTIVVLLILAGITINMLFSNNGIIKQAQDAQNAWENAESTDQEGMKNLEEVIGHYTNGTTGGNTSGNTAEVGKIVTGNNATYTDTAGKTAPIPVGFAVVTDPDTIANGLVISDKANDDMNNSQKGNQFVWIPVDDYSKFHLIEGYYNGSLDTMLSEASNPSREAGATATAGTPLANNSTTGTPESIAMYKSVKDNKGFYIARFEAGVPNTTASTTTNDANKQTQDGSVKPVSQKGAGVWNFIPWGGTTAIEATDGLPGNDNANGAVKVARSMYTKSSSCGVTSTLCYGVQWDAVLNFIEPNYVNGTATGFVKDSTDKGNYTGSIATTGKETAYEQKHVYDLAGNVYEWTMEAYFTDYRVGRGGGYGDTGSDFPASYRGSGGPDNSFTFIGFRVALYL